MGFVGLVVYLKAKMISDNAKAKEKFLKKQGTSDFLTREKLGLATPCQPTNQRPTT